MLGVVVLALAGATLAIGGGTGIWDDNHFAKPGSLDDGKDLLPQTTISLAKANAVAQRATTGSLGQVDLERFDGRVVYMTPRLISGWPNCAVSEATIRSHTIASSQPPPRQ